MSYEELRIQLMTAYPGLTFDAIDDMTFEQIDSLCRGGKRAEGVPVNSIEEAREIGKNWRKYLGI